MGILKQTKIIELDGKCECGNKEEYLIAQYKDYVLFNQTHIKGVCRKCLNDFLAKGI